MRCGNSTVAEIERLLRSNFADIEKFSLDPQASVLEIWPSQFLPLLLGTVLGTELRTN